MAVINNTHLHLKYMSQEELVMAINFAEARVSRALEDVAKLSSELALRAEVQLVIPELDNTVRY